MQGVQRAKQTPSRRKLSVSWTIIDCICAVTFSHLILTKTLGAVRNDVSLVWAPFSVEKMDSEKTFKVSTMADTELGRNAEVLSPPACVS